VLSGFVVRSVECSGGRVWVFLVGIGSVEDWWFLSVGQVSCLYGVIV